MTATPIADMVRFMLDRSAAPDVIIAAVAAAELSRGQSRDSHADKADRRRELDRLRKRKSREKSRQVIGSPEANDAGVSANCHADSHADNADNALQGTSDSPSMNPVVGKKNTDRVTGRAKRGTRLVKGHRVSEADRDFARALGMSEREIDEAEAEFVDYWIAVPGQRGTKLDWSATWRNRLRNSRSRGPPRRAPSPSFDEIADQLRTPSHASPERPDFRPQAADESELDFGSGLR